LQLAKTKISHVSDIAQKEAMILLSFATGLTQTEIITRDDTEFDMSYFFSIVERRAEHEPIEYITGKANFYSLEFDVSPDCLIPRPETELLVDMVVDEARKIDAKRIADICTGSGAIGITLAKELPNIRVIATDISQNALGVAKKNAKKQLVDDRVEFIHTDLMQNLPNCDIIVSNPPYIADSYELPNPVKYEPKLALFGGIDGSDIIKSLILQFKNHSARVLFCEFGYDQREIVENFCKNFSFTSLEFFLDYAGHTRGFILRK
jgi:release factor glutamine methyltransferase